MKLDDLLAFGVTIKACDQAFTLSGSYCDIVEGNVDISKAAESEAVIVDVLDTGCGSLFLDGCSGSGVKVDDGEHTDAVGDHLIGDGGHIVLVAFSVLDDALDAGFITSGLNEWPIEGFPAG